MRRTALFISRKVIGFFILSVCSLSLLLISTSPIRTDAPIAGIFIRGENNTFVRIWSHGFSCTKRDKLDFCTVNLQNLPLQMSLTYNDNSKTRDSITGCQGIFAQKPIKCHTYFDYATVNLPYVEIDNDLGLTLQQLQQLRKENFVAQINDGDWTNLAHGISIATAIVTAISIWIYTPQPNVIKVLASLISSGVTFWLSWYFLLISLLSLGFVD